MATSSFEPRIERGDLSVSSETENRSWEDLYNSEDDCEVEKMLIGAGIHPGPHENDKQEDGRLFRDLMTIAYIHPMDGFRLMKPHVRKATECKVFLDTQWLFSQLSPKNLVGGKPNANITNHLKRLIEISWHVKDDDRRESILSWFQNVDLTIPIDSNSEIAVHLEIDGKPAPTFEDCYGSKEKILHPRHVAQLHSRLTYFRHHEFERYKPMINGDTLRNLYRKTPLLFNKKTKPFDLKADDLRLDQKVWEWYYHDFTFDCSGSIKNPTGDQLKSSLKVAPGPCGTLPSWNRLDHIPCGAFVQNLESVLKEQLLDSAEREDILTLLKPRLLHDFSPEGTLSEDYFQAMEHSLRRLKSSEAFALFLHLTEVLPDPGRNIMRFWVHKSSSIPKFKFSDFYYSHDPSQKLILRPEDYNELREFLLHPHKDAFENGRLYCRKFFGVTGLPRPKNLPGKAQNLREKISAHLFAGTRIELKPKSLLQYTGYDFFDIPKSYWQFLFKMESWDTAKEGYYGPTEEEMGVVRAAAETMQRKRVDKESQRMESDSGLTRKRKDRSESSELGLSAMGKGKRPA